MRLATVPPLTLFASTFKFFLAPLRPRVASSKRWVIVMGAFTNGEDAIFAAGDALDNLVHLFKYGSAFIVGQH
jgi:hypothetical protein